MKTARELREQGQLAVPNSNSPNPVPHVRRGIEIEASEMRTARELREQARYVVPNSGCPDPVPYSRHDVGARASANAQEMNTAGEVREQARRFVPNSSCPNPVPHVPFQVGVEVDNVTGNGALMELRLDNFWSMSLSRRADLAFLSPSSPLNTALIVHRPAREETVRRGTFRIRCQRQGWPCHVRVLALSIDLN